MAQKKFLDINGLKTVMSKVKSEINEAAAAASAPKATSDSLGIVKPGSGVTVDSAGALSVDTTTIATKAAMTTAISEAKSELIGGAPETYDTLKEIADYIAEHANVETALNAAIGNKANSADVYSKEAADAAFVKDAEMSALTSAEITAALDEVFV